MKGLFVFLVTLMCFTTSAIANELEQEKLKEALEQLKIAKALFIDAKHHSSETSEVKLSYKKLLWDVSEIEHAIERHITKPSTKPRNVKELYLDYEQ